MPWLPRCNLNSLKPASSTFSPRDIVLNVAQFQENSEHGNTAPIG